MFRPAFRSAISSRAALRGQGGRRFASTTSSRSGTWKGSAVRWAAAGAVVYYYNTSSVFAEEPQYSSRSPVENTQDSDAYPSIHSISEQRRAQARASVQQSQHQTRIAEQSGSTQDEEQVAVGSPGDLEEEAEQQGAFNEETGEINWDCPCLGGMAHGPCGEQFRAAFSCFVFSKEEPKGVDCIEHFKTMQNCFREHPDIYGSELDEEGVDAQLDQQSEQQDRATTTETATALESTPTPATTSTEVPSDANSSVPKAWHDERQSSSESIQK